MRKKGALFILLFAFLISPFVFAEGITEIKKIPDLAGSNESPSIAANMDGDIMIIYRNGNSGVIYYYREHDETKWIGPSVLPGQTYSKTDYANIWWTDVEPTSDGKFHAFWGLRVHGAYYASFDPATKKWSSLKKVANGYVESPIIKVNPLNDDVVILWIDRAGSAKNVMVRIKKHGSKDFDDKFNISKFRYSATNQYACFDEEGFLYIVYKQDKLNAADDLMIKLALLDSNNKYRLEWLNELTWEFPGWHMLPAADVIGKKGLLSFAWFQKRRYHYLPFERKYNENEKKWEIVFDNSNLENLYYAKAPRKPNFEYHSKVLKRGDEEYLVFYKDLGFSIKMLKYKDDEWENLDNPIDLCNKQASAYTFDVFMAPCIGVLSAWFNREDKASVYYSIYDYPMIVIFVESALNINVKKNVEKSFFYTGYINYLTWEDNPYNTENNINVVKYRIYRKLKSESITQYKLIKEIDKGTLYLEDKDNISANDLYSYYVTCVDDEDNESLIIEDEDE